MGSASMRKQMKAQKSGSCGVKDLRNKHYIHNYCVRSWVVPPRKSKWRHKKLEVVVCKTLQINTTFIVIVFVHVPKHVYQMDFCSLLDC